MKLKLENILTPIKSKYIIELIDNLYEPYKIYGDLELLLKNSPKYVYPTNNFDGQLKKWVENGKKSYVILNPKKDDIDKIKEFRLIESVIEKIHSLMKLQHDWNKKDTTLAVANKLEEKIKISVNEINTELSLIDQIQSLRHYRKTKRFAANFNIVYEQYEYEKLKSLLEEEFKRYSYILRSEKIDRLEFHFDYKEKLEVLKKIQKHEKIIKIISNQINNINLKYESIDEKLLNEKTENKTNSKTKPPQQKSLREIALILVYEGKSATRKKCKAIALENGHKSGDALYNNYTYYSSRANRKGKPAPYTKKKLKNKIELFEKVIKNLKNANKNRALEELKILNIHYKNDFE